MKERLATVVYAIFTVIGLSTFVLSWFSLFSGEIFTAVMIIVFALIAYGIGWSIRYIITGNKNSFILDIFLNSFSKKKLTLFAIANLPIYDFTNQTKPMNLAEEKSNLSNDDNLNSIIYSGILSFQFFIYLELIKSRFGKEPSTMAKEHICITLDRFGQESDTASNLGQEIKIYIDIISKIYEADPIIVNVDGKEIILPKEYDVALTLLHYIKYSPYYAKDKKKEDWPDIKDDLDIKFADILEEARTGMVDRYSPMFLNKNIHLDKSSSLGIRIEDKLAA